MTLQTKVRTSKPKKTKETKNLAFEQRLYIFTTTTHRQHC